MRKFKRVLTACILASAFVIPSIPSIAPDTSVVYADESIDEIKEKNAEREKKKKEAENKLANLESEADDIRGVISELDEEINQYQGTIDDLTAKRNALQAKASITKSELQIALIAKENQYDRMKERIAYSYENGDIHIMDALIALDDFSNVINQSEYVEQVSDYDQKQLTDLIAISKEVSKKEKQLQKELNEVEKVKEDTEAEQDALKIMQEGKREKLNEYGSLISDTEGEISEYDALIEEGKKNFAEKVHIELDLAKALSGAYIVIESMTEEPKAKIGMYNAMKDLLDEDTILCTNSSTLLPSMFAQYTGRPEKYCALHFANTIWKNNTGEVMGHPGTDPAIYQKVVEFAAAIGMVPLQLHKEQPGYILNSMLVPFLSAAQALWANGVADPETIDLTWRLATSAPAGPFQILDIVGQMKPAAQVEGTLENRMGKLLKEKIDRGETGVNAGKGFYDYTKK